MDQPALAHELLPLQLPNEHVMGLLQAHAEQARQLQLQQAQPLQQQQNQHPEQEEYMEAEGQDEDEQEQDIKPVKKPQSSQYTGVVWNAANNKYRAAIKHEGRKVFLGNYSDEETAARAFDRAAIKLRGQGTRTNFPVNTYGDVDALVAEGVQGLPPARPVGRPRKHPLPDPNRAPKRVSKKRRTQREVLELDGVQFEDAGAYEEALEASLPPYKRVAGLYYISPEAAMNNPALDAVRRAIDAALAVPAPQSLLEGSAAAMAFSAGAAREGSTSLSLGEEGLKREPSLPPGFQLPRRKVGRPSNAEKAARAALEAAALAAGDGSTPPEQGSSMPASLNALLLAASAADAEGSEDADLAAQRAATFLQPVGPNTSLAGLMLSAPSPSAAAAMPGTPGFGSSSPGSELQLPAVPSNTAQQGKQKPRVRVLKHLPPGYSDVSDVPHYKGVSWQDDKDKWRASLSLPMKKKQHIGYFEDPEEAARAYDRAALQYHGAGTTTNFPLSDYLSPAQLATAAAAGHLPIAFHRPFPPKKRGRPPKNCVTRLPVEGAAGAAGTAAAASEAATTAAATSALGALAAGAPAAAAAAAAAAAKGQTPPPASAIAAAYAAAAAAASAQRHAASLAATGAGQAGGAAGAGAGGAVQYEGVSYVAESNKYSASFPDPVDKQKMSELGLYDTAEEAARAYDRAAVRIQGVGARTNFGLDQYMDIINAQLLASINVSFPQPVYLVSPTASGAQAASLPAAMDSTQLQELLAREQATRVKQTLQLTQLALQQQQQQQQQAGAAAAAALPWDAAAVALAVAGAAGGASAASASGAAGSGSGTPSGRQRSRKTPPASAPAAAAAATQKPPLPPLALQLPALQQVAASLVPPAGLDALTQGTTASTSAASTDAATSASAAVNPMASAIPLSATAAAALLQPALLQPALAASISAAPASAPPSLFMMLPQGVQIPALSLSPGVAGLGSRGNTNGAPSPGAGYGFPMAWSQ